MNLKNKKILLFMPSFYGYDLCLKESLESAGAQVLLESTSYDYILSKKNKLNLRHAFQGKRREREKQKYLIELQNKYNKEFFDALFVIELCPFNEDFIFSLKEINNNLTTYIFFWDSFSEIDQRYLVSFFDHSFSFNKDDVDAFNNKKLKYLPDFYIESSISSCARAKYDISFVGTVTGPTLYRYKFLQDLGLWCKRNDLKYNFYLRHQCGNVSHNLFFSFLRFIFSPEYNALVRFRFKSYNSEFIHSEKISLEQVSNIENNSNCLVDLSHKDRQGLTIGALTAIARGKKLLTTNSHIIKANFYHPNNILVVDSLKPEFERSFFSSQVVPVDISCLNIFNWVYMIFDDDYYNKHIASVS